jgi:hypothetical protein
MLAAGGVNLVFPGRLRRIVYIIVFHFSALSQCSLRGYLPREKIQQNIMGFVFQKSAGLAESFPAN